MKSSNGNFISMNEGNAGHDGFSGQWPVPTLVYSTAARRMARSLIGPTIVTKTAGRPTSADVILIDKMPAAGTAMFSFGPPVDPHTVVMYRHGGPATGDRRGGPGQETAPGYESRNCRNRRDRVRTGRPGQRPVLLGGSQTECRANRVGSPLTAVASSLLLRPAEMFAQDTTTPPKVRHVALHLTLR